MELTIQLLRVLVEWIAMMLPFAVVTGVVCFSPVFEVKKKKVGLIQFLLAEFM